MLKLLSLTQEIVINPPSSGGAQSSVPEEEAVQPVSLFALVMQIHHYLEATLREESPGFPFGCQPPLQHNELPEQELIPIDSIDLQSGSLSSLTQDNDYAWPLRGRARRRNSYRLRS